MKNAMFERDLLYPTYKHFEPGSVHIMVYPPENSGHIPIIIESKSAHNPVEYIPSIIEILQEDVFNRIEIKIKECGRFFIKSVEHLPWYLVEFTGKDEYSVKEVEQSDLQF